MRVPTLPWELEDILWTVLDFLQNLKKKNSWYLFNYLKASCPLLTLELQNDLRGSLRKRHPQKSRNLSQLRGAFGENKTEQRWQLSTIPRHFLSFVNIFDTISEL